MFGGLCIATLSSKMCVLFQIHIPRLPLCPFLVAMYIFCWWNNNGQYWQAAGNGESGGGGLISFQ